MNRHRLSVLLVLVSTLVWVASFTTWAETARNRMDELEEVFVIKKDDFQGITFVHHPLQDENPRREVDAGGRFCEMSGFDFEWRCDVRLFPYIGYDSSAKWMFVRAYFRGREWLFMDKALVVVGDDRFETPSYHSHSNFVQRDSSRSGVLEVIHFRWSDSDVEDIGRAVIDANADEVIRIRFHGSKGNIDFALTQEERQAWEDIIYYFDNLEVGQ